MHISYELHPISTQKNFGDRVVERSREQEMLLTRAKPIINDMAIFSNAIKYLQTKAPSSEKDYLNKKADEIDYKIYTFSMAGINNEITQEMIEDLRSENLSDFLESDYYKELLKKMNIKEDSIKTGKFLLKFDNKYLTPKKALGLEVNFNGGNMKCTLRDKNGHIDYDNLNVYFPPFRCPINYVSDDSDFKDKDLAFPGDKCYDISADDEPLKATDINNTRMHYEINGDEAKVHFTSKFHYGLHYHDCNGYHTVKRENKETDLPIFHILDKNSDPIGDMRYHMIAAEEKDKIQDIWNVQKAPECDEIFNLTNMARQDRKLCMYDFTGYYSVVIDKAPDFFPECQWFKKDGFLFNRLHNRCIAKAGNLPNITAPENTIQLSGYYDDDNHSCVNFEQELNFESLENQRMLRKFSVHAEIE